MVYDVGRLAGLGHSPPPCQRPRSQGRSPRWDGVYADRPVHRRGLGATHVGHMVGMGPKIDRIFDPFLFYLGYMALWAAVENPDTAADLTAVLCLVGTVFAVISRYAILFWNQGLHQGASLSMDAEENVADVFAYPLWICIIGFGLLFICLVLLRTRTEIRARRLSALIAQERMA